ncbi:MAG: ATP-binding protein [Caldisericia bacterium]|nr:ATP-binding protein [Caldisericia bacterium]MDD4614988.1 ATP-binding protein [Caldisericia bacterium]
MDKQITNITILLIEQNAGNARLIEGLLQGSDDFDIEISWASRLDDGIRLAQSKSFQVCLLDLTMKEHEGYEALSILTSHCPALSVIALTENIQASDIRRMYLIGAKDILVKNKLNTTDLLRSIYSTKLSSIKCIEDSNIVHAMSNQFRGILANAKASVDMIRKGSVGDLNKYQIDLCDVALHNMNKINALASDFVEYTDLVKGSVNFVKREEDIVKTIKETLAVIRSDAEKKNLRLYFDENVSNAMVLYDRDSIVKLLLHLLHNSITFTEQGDIVVSCSIKDKQVIIQIQDTGIGIAESDLQSIFEPFTLIQLTDEYKRKQGSGLGLAISKKIAQLHGGDLQISSKIRVGTTYTLTLPFKGS